MSAISYIPKDGDVIVDQSQRKPADASIWALTDKIPNQLVKSLTQT
jgi:hypothetical protein